MVDEQKPGIDKPAPKSMSGRDVAAWLRQGQRKFAKNQVAERAAAEVARQNAEASRRAALAEQTRQEKIAAIRASATQAVQANVTPGKVASFMLLPQLNLSLRGFNFALGLLVLFFARVVIAVGLLPPDHPASTLSGAQSFGFFRLLSEARLNLLPLRALRENDAGGEFAGIRTLAVRQYATFIGTIGMLGASAASVLYGLSHVIFKTAHAYAQSSTVTTSGTGIGCTFNINSTAAASSTSGAEDMASSCLDVIFGTGSSGTTSSLANSGLGKMLAAYSNTVLVVAGIMVLWIIISMVMETARTGVPFGKNFNPVWTPIRLIVALGLLVPLSSGLNSGQYITVNMAKWGSQQATSLWSNYATTLAASPNGTGGTSTSGTGTNGTQAATTSGIQSVLMNNVAAQNMANNLFNALLCEESANAVSACNSDANCQVTQQETTLTPSATSQTIPAGGTSQSTSLISASQIGITWGSKDPTIGLNCGTLAVPTTSTNSSSTGSTSQSAIPQAVTTSINSIVESVNTNTTTLVTGLDGVAKTLAQAAVKCTNANTSTDGSDNCAPNADSVRSSYNTAMQQFVSQQSSSIASALQTYNQSVGANLTTEASAYGWMAAPIWISDIAAQNASVVGATQALPTVTGPKLDSNGNLNNTAGVMEAVGNTYTEASTWVSEYNLNAASALSLPSSKSQQATDTLRNDLQNITSNISGNPLAAAGTYGRSMIINGFVMIQPQENIKCMQEPTSDGTDGCSNFIAAKNAIHNGAASDHTILPSSSNKFTFDQPAKNGQLDAKGALFPVGMIMISMGFLLVMITFIPLTRFLLGVLNWIMQIFIAVLSVPMMALSLLSSLGEGFATQQFTTNMYMLLGMILRPILMALGLVLGLAAFNSIMGLAGGIFSNYAADMTPLSDNSLLTMGIYLAVYASLAYTMANSAFKMVDLMPNWVMNWVGARLDTYVDDASIIQGQVQQYTSTLAYSSSRGGGSGQGTAAGQFQQDSQTLNAMNQAGMSNTQQYKDLQNQVQAEYGAMKAEQAAASKSQAPPPAPSKKG